MTKTTTAQLFTPIKLGDVTLKHRVVMPALSRLRAHWPSAVPSDLMLEHYSQRASDGGLIITESTAIAPEARAYHAAPGIWNDAQVAAWKRITDAVHAKGGVMFVQLGHAGRATSEALTGIQPVSASADPTFTENPNVVVTTPEGLVPPSPHRALEIDQIAGILGQYRLAARNAVRAGFDGIEIFSAQGHLVEQFLQDGSNKRADRYGGSVENRTRFLMEIVDTVAGVIGRHRVGVRISPSSTFNGMSDSDPQALFEYVAERLDRFGVAYLHIIEPRISGADTVAEGQDAIAAKDLSRIFRGTIIAAGGFTPESAEEAVADGVASLVAFGRHFTSNPDLPARIEHGLPLTPYDRNTFYGGGAQGYVDFPAYHAEAVLELA
ncbi:alkene reductase [Sphingomonas oligoaromativorans]|uniref:oxidoreductase n=1 Tax=Sphingomonas oligoaromativorans TaxID=575322 RepID=UPI00142191FA|nr:N-ethylmaleimide reductase [Sphingomonas oligoaromativorans]